MLRPILAEAAPEQTAWLCRGDLEGPLPPRTGGVPEGQGRLERRALQFLSEWGVASSLRRRLWRLQTIF